MAYAQYQQQQQPYKSPGVYKDPQQDPYQLPELGIPGQTSTGQQSMPVGDGQQLPTNTRQQAVQNVQQAYAGRMPGQMDALNSALSNFAAPVGLNDPSLQPALRAGAGADQRSFERQRAALAEVMGANGLGDSGGFNTQLQNIGQQIGEAGAQRDANLVYNEMGSRRNALLSALGLDQQRYNVDNDLALQLARLEAQLNTQAISPFLSY